MSTDSDWKTPPAYRQLTGEEPLTLAEQPYLNTCVLDFWRWAFSDFRMNNVRGILAEFVVASLLDIPLSVRDSWTSYDLVSRDGITIEVKAAAYLQAWNQRRLSRIVFTGLLTRPWTPEGGHGELGYGADVYIFCLLAENDPARFDPLDLDQWLFWLLSKEQLIAINRYRPAVSLTCLQQAGVALYSAAQLAEGKTEMLQRLMTDFSDEDNRKRDVE